MKKLVPYIRCICFLIIVIILVIIFDYVFSPAGYIRYILHLSDSPETNYDTVILGASHTRSGIDPAKLNEALNCKAINLAIPGETVPDSYYILKNACKHNDVKTVIFDVDYQYWMEGQVQHEFTTPFIFNKFKWTDKIKAEYLIDNMSWIDYRQTFSNRLSYTLTMGDAIANLKFKSGEAYKNYTIEGAIIKDADGPYVGDGFFYRETSGFPPGGHNYINLWVGRENGAFEEFVIDYFLQIYNYCNANNLELICITTPITPTAVSILGLEKVDKKFTDFFNKYNIPYYNFNKLSMDVLPRDDINYGDMEGHMGGELAEQFSTVLGQFLKERNAGTLDTNKYFYSTFKELEENSYRDRIKKTKE